MLKTVLSSLWNCLMILIILQSILYFISGHSSFVTGHFNKATVSNQAPESCTILTASHGDKVLFGNNEDWINPNTYYWTVPRTNDTFGVVYFGFDNFCGHLNYPFLL